MFQAAKNDAGEKAVRERARARLVTNANSNSNSGNLSQLIPPFSERFRGRNRNQGGDRRRGNGGGGGSSSTSSLTWTSSSEERRRNGGEDSFWGWGMSLIGLGEEQEGQRSGGTGGFLSKQERYGAEMYVCMHWCGFRYVCPISQRFYVTNFSFFLLSPFYLCS